MKKSILLAPSVALAAFFAASPAFACAVCGFGPDQSNWAFLKGTALLSLMPLGVIGSAVFFVGRRMRAADAAEATANPLKGPLE